MIIQGHPCVIADYVADMLSAVEQHVFNGTKAVYAKANAPTLASTGPEQGLSREQVMERHQTRGIATKHSHHQPQVDHRHAVFLLDIMLHVCALW